MFNLGAGQRYEKIWTLLGLRNAKSNHQHKMLTRRSFINDLQIMMISIRGLNDHTG